MKSITQVAARRYDMDWLRVITIGLLLIYHIAIAFQPWGIYIGFIQSTKSLEWLWVPMAMLNVWRIPILFFISGIGLSFAMRQRTLKQLFVERSKRIVLPFIFGVLAIVPIHTMLWERYYSQDINLIFNPSHLWFLGNIFTYVMLVVPIIYFLRTKANASLIIIIRKLFSGPFALLLMVVLLIAETFIVKSTDFVLYAMTWHGFAYGLIVFFFGFAFVKAGEFFFNWSRRFAWYLLVFASALYLVRLLVFELMVPHYLLAIESVLWIFTMFGLASRYLNKAGKTLSYLSKAAYPVYIVHMAWLYLACIVILPLSIGTVSKLLLIILMTFAGCMLSYEFVIRRVKYVRPLFGLRF